MTDTSERPSHITLEEPEFPYLIDQQGLNAHSYAVIQHTDLFNKDRELFYLVYPEISFTPNGRDSMSSAEINVKHTFARDPEHSSSSIARFEIASLQMSSAFSGTITYTGWLTSARFYRSIKVRQPLKVRLSMLPNRVVVKQCELFEYLSLHWG